MGCNIQKNLQIIHRELLLEDLRRCVRCLAQITLSMKEYAKIGDFNVNSYIRTFGSWNAAVEKAGIQPNLLVFISSDELMENIKIVSQKLKKVPKWKDMIKPLSKYDRHTYCYRYGSWSKALIAFKDYALKQMDKERELRAKKRNHKREAISKGLRYDVLKRDKFTCRCGRSPEKDSTVVLHVDHKIPVSKGGTNTMENLETLCDLCNFGKGAKID